MADVEYVRKLEQAYIDTADDEEIFAERFAGVSMEADGIMAKWQDIHGQ